MVIEIRILDGSGGERNSMEKEHQELSMGMAMFYILIGNNWLQDYIDKDI